MPLEKEIIWANSMTGDDFQCVHVDFAREQQEEIKRLREAVKYAIEELDKFSDFMGAEGYFTYAKEVKGMVLPKLAGFLAAGQLTK